MAQRLLLLSNSRDPAGAFLEWPRDAIRALFGEARRLLFVDTEAIVTRMWSRVFFGAELEDLEPLIGEERYHL